MPHFRVDDALHSHPKARKAGFEAMGMWTLAGSHCMAYLTDGFVAAWWVKEKPKGVALAKRLVEAGFWHVAEKDGEQGWQFHEFTGPGRNDSREQILADREKWRKRKESQRASTHVSPVDNTGDTTVDAPQDTRESPGYIPNPTQPNVKNSGYEPSKSPVSSATDGARGTRLPDGWEPPADVIAQMRADHPHVDAKAEHAKFVDYWRAQPGAKGRKADWNGTWRNWIRRAAEQRAPRAANGNGHSIPTSDLRVAQVQALKTQPSARRLELE